MKQPGNAALRRLVRRLAVGFLACFLVSLAPVSPLAFSNDAGSSERSTIEVRLLANAGFLIRGDSSGVLIDAFVGEPYSIYEAVSEDALEELAAGGAPFHTVRLALASHVHRDHFQPEFAGVFLRTRTDVAFWSAPQVIDALNDVDRRAAHAPNVRSILPVHGETSRQVAGDIAVEFLNIPHGSKQHSHIENLAHIVTIEGHTVLHLGDATMDQKLYEPYALAKRNVDVALVPYWFFDDPNGKRTLELHIRARYTVAMHIPPAKRDAITKQLRTSHPKVHILEPMQFVRF